ncbi:2-(S)-hydroxypropyl-CoM dehydrogenase [Microbacterium oxydans]|uniref:2-(S)-hydroxypropyl-CoM dehydrogenase n=1 Tax=Microbacterium oxydans TaxID=82380 RepID=A0A0F0KPZ5_9MICO|nr:SDR family oxidoreductase [Microbacterium oxydans]KJL22992.1 2-(S)-hydroxypropyl-CoM dehydrogenase [Microbacterium oxydans]
MSDFSGIRAIVTGGASGIGAATTRLLRERGAVVSVLDVNVGTPPDVHAFTVDLADAAAVEAAVAAAGEAMGGIDVVVNNAGIGAQGTVEDNTDDEWHRVYDVNVVGAVRVTRAALPHLRASASASVVNTCSVAATNGLPARALYSATKGAVLALTRAMATDHVAEGIRVNAVSPGTAATPWVDRLLSTARDPDAERAALDRRQAIGRLVTPEEVAEAIAYLASPRNASTTGIVLEVDGGLSHLRVRPES